MFKVGELAGIKGQTQRVTVLSGAPKDSAHPWPVLTSGGIFDETELFVVDPAVLATATGRDLAREHALDYMHSHVVAEGLSGKLREQIEKALKKATFQWNGHWKNGAVIFEDFRVRLLKNLFIMTGDMLVKDAEDLVHAARAKRPLDRWVPVSVSEFRMSFLRRCSFCGAEDFDLETNGEEVRIAGAPCPYPKGLPPTEWELNVPSGKLVVANDLREVFPLPEDEDFDINGVLGCRQTALAYAANGLSHAFVGNTSPGVFRCKDGTYKIANPPDEDEWNGKDWVKIKPKPKFDGKRLAGICTDLWWYSICDEAEFKRRCRRFKKKEANVTIIDVDPGVYRFRHDEEAQSHKGPSECIYTRFERVRKADPVKDYLADYEAAEVNPHAYVQAQVERWPTLYGKVKHRLLGKEEVTSWSDMTKEDRLHSWQRVADQVFCVIGSGTEWHENGFPRAKVDASVPDVEPPSFRTQHHWYPFSRPYGGLFEPKVLTPSFAKLAFRILESVISFGTDVHDGAQSREVIYVRERMLVAVKRYRELAKKYPDQADPEYVAWLGQKGRAEAWVANFDLGPEYTEKHREHAKQQRWVPEDAYAVEFDARKLKEGHFAWHPKNGGCWANKKDAERYAILEWTDNEQPAEHNCFWASHATNTSVPLYSVARVTKVGAVSHMGETLVELAFDYGTPWMKDSGKRKALAEAKEKAGIRVLSREEYEGLLPTAIQFFKTAEAIPSR